MFPVPLFPEQASTNAPRVDNLFFFLIAITGTAAVLIALTLLFFTIIYRKRPGSPPPPRILGSLPLEILWTAIPFAIFLFIFAWSADVYFAQAQPPDDALDVYIVGKQWM